jgi:CubicO group peptidase (beta-lactamase class C family)
MKMKMMLGAACLGALLVACGGGEQPASRPPVPEKVLLTGAALQDALERVRADNGFPGLSVVTVDNGRIEAFTTGKRVIGGVTPISAADRFQLGSLTKGASAMLVARLVEQKKLRWDSNLAELFPAWRAQMAPALRGVTVEQLLRHRAGLKRDLDEADGVVLRPLVSGDITLDRATAAQHVLMQAPAITPNTKYAYSNLAYMLVGLIAEVAGGGSYAQLMEAEVFGPLQIKASFGLPEDGGAGVLSGHEWQGNSWTPALYGEEQRLILAVMEPAGGMMASMADYGKYLQQHLLGLQGKSAFLSQDTFRLMHTPVDTYGLGWVVGDDAVIGHYSVHGGSIGTYYAITILVPESNRAVAVSCNCYSDAAVDQIDRFARQLASARR